MTISYENTEYEFTDEYVNIKIKGIEKKYDRVYFIMVISMDLYMT